MNEQFEEIIKAAQLAEEAKQAAARQENESAINEVRQRLVTALGDELIEQFKEQGIKETIKASTEYSSQNISIFWQVEGSDANQLYPIVFRAANKEKVRAKLGTDLDFYRSDDYVLPDGLGEILYAARTAWSKWRVERGEAQLANLTRWSNVADVEQARLDALRIEYPEISSQLDAAQVKRDAVLEERRIFDARQAEKKAKEQKYMIERRAYLDGIKSAYIEYVKARNSIMERNIRRRKLIQEWLDNPIQLFKLTYGILVGDESGDFVVGKQTDYMSSDVCTDTGYWTRFDDTLVKYWHPVSIEPVLVQASTAHFLDRKYINLNDYHLQKIVYFPWRGYNEEMINLLCQADDFEKLPVFDWPEDLSSSESQALFGECDSAVERLADGEEW